VKDEPKPLVRVPKRHMWRYRLTEQVPVLAQVIGESTRKKRGDAAARDDAPSLYYVIDSQTRPESFASSLWWRVRHQSHRRHRNVPTIQRPVSKSQMAIQLQTRRDLAHAQVVNNSCP